MDVAGFLRGHGPAPYEHLRLRYDAGRAALWSVMDPRPRPCFTPLLVVEINDFYRSLAGYLRAAQGDDPPVHYLILASSSKEVFSLGGDLELFRRTIEAGDRETLTVYARGCVDALYLNAVNMHCPSLTTISLIQGPALGGGFEAALSSNVVIAERSVALGFPEILFNLFPGMGAFSLIARRLDLGRAERIISDPQQYTSAELHASGLVDVVAEDGAGAQAVSLFILRHGRSRHALQAIRHARQRIAPLDRAELTDVVMIWVDAAMSLSPRDLRMMERLTSAQTRLAARVAGAVGRLTVATPLEHSSAASDAAADRPQRASAS